MSHFIIPFIIFLIIVAIVSIYFVHRAIKDITDVYWLKHFGPDQQPNKQQSPTTNNLVPQFKTDNDFDYFRKGMDYGFTILHMSLYKMFVDNNLLDYDSLNVEVRKNIDIFINNPELMKNWNQQYIKYANEKFEEQERNKDHFSGPEVI